MSSPSFHPAPPPPPLLYAAMRPSVVTFVMVICCVTMAQADVTAQRDFYLPRFFGKWYRVGLAYDSPAFVPYRDKVRISMGIVAAQPHGNVNLTMWESGPTGCMRKQYQYEKTNVPGQFTYFSTRHHKVKDITVVETNYTDYAFVVKNKVFNREYTQIALYGRTQRVKPDIIQRFKALATSLGFPRESILTPPPAENCPGSGV
ncbi:neutrophil gelatinase-associated lipocalin [Genypterus blacodes]|uniref:neutrophil gelatinase-associated lipocalin n=1 Tax=Genypterus blacodes TaxID=154954 RepID=UPI003F75C0E1